MAKQVFARWTGRLCRIQYPSTSCKSLPHRVPGRPKCRRGPTGKDKGWLPGCAALWPRGLGGFGKSATAIVPWWSAEQGREVINDTPVKVAAQRVDHCGSQGVAEPCQLSFGQLTRGVDASVAQFAARGQAVKWVSVDGDKVAGKVIERPTRDAIPLNAQEQLIVELYSK